MFQCNLKSLSIWCFENLSEYNEIFHFISSRKGGVSKAPYDSLNLGSHVGDDYHDVLENRRILAQALGISIKNFMTCRQVHSNQVTIVTEDLIGSGGVEADSADAIVTDIPKICLLILVADCVPIIFFDPLKKAIAVAHAGWRGTHSGIAQNTLKALMNRFNSLPEDVIVGIGPSIGPCCYEVGPKVVSRFKGILDVRFTKDGKGFLNLWEINRKQLIEMGVLAQHIEVAGLCTCCHPDMFFSYRNQKAGTGRFAAGIMIKDRDFLQGK